MTEEEIRKTAREPNKFYRRICLILNKEISIMKTNEDPDIDTNHKKLDEEENRLDKRVYR